VSQQVVPIALRDRYQAYTQADLTRLRGSGVDRDREAGELARVERVLHALLDRHVARDNGDRAQVDVGMP